MCRLVFIFLHHFVSFRVLDFIAVRVAPISSTTLKCSFSLPTKKLISGLVRLFKKFRKKDFTILSVSLDNNIDAWKKAIEKDGLIWKNHVSDLLGWESPLTKIYKFNQIPHTVLVNKEGKIIAKNLRGKQLENKLLEILK